MSFPPPSGGQGPQDEGYDPFAPPSPFGSPEPSVGPVPSTPAGDPRFAGNDSPDGPPSAWPYDTASPDSTLGSNPYGPPAPVGYQAAAISSNQIATWALTLAILGLCCGFLSIAGFVMSLQAKQAVAQGRANNGGVASAAMAISVITFVLSSVVVMSNLRN